MVNSKAPSWTGPQKVTLSVKEGDRVFVSSDGTDDRDSRDVLDIYWDVGDGTIVHDTALEHVYKVSGLFKIILTADDGYGGIANETLAVYVENNPPRASFTEKGVKEGIRFDATETEDDEWDMDGLRYIWDFGDGADTETSDPIVVHDYTYGGEYTVKLTVIDSDGGFSVLEKKIEAPGPTKTVVWGSVALILLVIIAAIVGSSLYLRKRMIETDSGFSDLFRKGPEEASTFRDHRTPPVRGRERPR